VLEEHIGVTKETIVNCKKQYERLKKVPPDEYDPESGWEGIDKEIIPLCDVINSYEHFATIASCGGHEKPWFGFQVVAEKGHVEKLFDILVTIRQHLSWNDIEMKVELARYGGIDVEVEAKDKEQAMKIMIELFEALKC